MFAEYSANEGGLLVISLIGLIMGFWALMRSQAAPTLACPANPFVSTAPSQEGEQNRQLQGLNKHLGELRGELKQLKEHVNTNEEGDEALRDRYEKLEDALNKFAFKQKVAWSEFVKVLDDLVPDSDEPVKDEDDEEEKCGGCELPKEDCICKDEEEEEDEDEEEEEEAEEEDDDD